MEANLLCVYEVNFCNPQVTKFKEGDLAGVGCLVDSCRECHPCKGHEEQFCSKGPSFTYNGTEMDKKTRTYGGYSTHVMHLFFIFASACVRFVCNY